MLSSAIALFGQNLFHIESANPADDLATHQVYNDNDIMAFSDVSNAICWVTNVERNGQQIPYIHVADYIPGSGVYAPINSIEITQIDDITFFNTFENLRVHAVVAKDAVFWVFVTARDVLGATLCMGSNAELIIAIEIDANFGTIIQAVPHDIAPSSPGHQYGQIHAANAPGGETILAMSIDGGTGYGLTRLDATGAEVWDTYITPNVSNQETFNLTDVCYNAIADEVAVVGRLTTTAADEGFFQAFPFATGSPLQHIIPFSAPNFDPQMVDVEGDLNGDYIIATAGDWEFFTPGAGCNPTSYKRSVFLFQTDALWLAPQAFRYVDPSTCGDIVHEPYPIQLRANTVSGQVEMLTYINDAVFPDVALVNIPTPLPGVLTLETYNTLPPASGGNIGGIDIPVSFYPINANGTGLNNHLVLSHNSSSGFQFNPGAYTHIRIQDVQAGACGSDVNIPFTGSSRQVTTRLLICNLITLNSTCSPIIDIDNIPLTGFVYDCSFTTPVAFRKGNISHENWAINARYSSTDNTIRVKATGVDEVVVSVYDMQGRLILSNVKNTLVWLPELAPGVFILKVSGKYETKPVQEIKRIVIQ